jgi:aminopeptidase-like protein
MFLLQESNNALFEPKIKPKDNILRKAQIDDVVNLVKSIEKGKITASISLYLQELPNGQRGLVSHISGDTTEQQSVFSWAVILHYAAQNYDKKDISFIHDIMGETIKAYSAGADPDNVQNTVIVPNNSFFRIKQKR